MNKEESYAKIASLLVSIMPTKWEQVVFSLLVRKCIVNKFPFNILYCCSDKYVPSTTFELSFLSICFSRVEIGGLL